MPKRFIKSFKYARAGAAHALRTQRNIWVHLVIGALVLAAGYWLKLSNLELAIVVLTIAFVLAAEMFNTAIEVIVDHLSPEFREEAGLIKNVAAGAVLMAACGAAVAGAIVFLPRLVQ